MKADTSLRCGIPDTSPMFCSDRFLKPQLANGCFGISDTCNTGSWLYFYMKNSQVHFSGIIYIYNIDCCSKRLEGKHKALKNNILAFILVRTKLTTMGADSLQYVPVDSSCHCQLSQLVSSV